MPIEKSVLLDRLASLTADLRPAPGTSAQALEEAHLAVAGALAAGQPEADVLASSTIPLSARSSVAVSPQSALGTAAEQALSHLGEAEPVLVRRRSLPLNAAAAAAPTPDWTSGRAVERTLGPFLDLLGRPTWIDIFPIVRQVSLVRSAGAAPFLTVPIKGITTLKDRFSLPAGSVWIASPQIAAGAPPGSYTGLLIKGGTIEFSHPLIVIGNEIVVPAAVACTLALKLDPGAAAAGTGPGEDARLSTADVPATVTFKFTSAGAKIEALGKASLQVYGSGVKMTPAALAPVYAPLVALILVPMTADVPSFAVTDVRSDEFEPAGTAPIDMAAWALPVAVVAPASLGAAAGAGGLALVLKEGLSLTWKGQTSSVPAGELALTVGPGLISIVALTALGLGARETIPLWSNTPGGPVTSRLELGWPQQFPLRYFSSSAGFELILFLGSVSGSLDRPVTVGGSRVYLQSKLALISFLESNVFSGVIVETLLDPPPPPTSAYAFAIANAVFRTTPAAWLILVAAYDGTQSPSGAVGIGFGLQYLLPTLPDPYAANVGLPYQGRGDFGSTGTLTAIVLWTPAAPPLLTYVLPPNAMNLVGASATSHSLVAAPVTSRSLVASTEASVGVAGYGGALILLDLSTNVDQFGVAWWSAATRDKAGAGGALAVESMYLESRSDSVYVLTLPAVQWEPVFTEPPPEPPYPAGFPSPMTFANSGGPTAIMVQSVKLVRVAPAPALDNLVANFNTDPSPATALARLTLPFGIEAFPTLVKPSSGSPQGAMVSYNRPTFTSESVTGGHQISLRAIDPSNPDSPSFQGYTTQLRNGQYFGLPTGDSVLGVDVDTIFNTYLGLGGLRPQVPVVRLDLSGYGESLFSHWLNDTDDVTAVSQAHFDVLIGRTACEVVQVRSILYPYGVRVVRTITIQRKNSAVVRRTDSGWQAVSDGAYLFPGGTLTVHPGVVQKISQVTNIRDTGQLLDVGGGTQVAGVLFDGSLAIDGVVKGASDAGVPARDQIGYVQLTASTSSLSSAEYQQLINTAGPLGGTIDCVLSVGGGGQLHKLGRVGVGVTEGMGGPEFVMTAWGSPQFPTGGQWSFLRQTGAGTAPEVVDQDLGIPLIRAGAAPAPPPLSSPYRFADPVDLSSPDFPASDYGIVHATGTQRVFFPRPIIQPTTSDHIQSTRAPILADPYSLATSVGYFPRTDTAIPFPNANYSIVITGVNYKLVLPAPTFPVTVGQRTLSQAGGVRCYADYGSATVQLAIDTAAAVPWSFQLQKATVVVDSGLFGEIMRITSTVDAAANIVTNLIDPGITFGGAFSIVQGVLAFLEALGFPSPLSVAMTNKLQLKAGLKIPMDEELNKLLPPGGPEFDDTDVVVSFVIDSPLAEADFELGATLLVPTPFDPLKAVGMFKLEIKTSTDSGNSFELTVGVGIGVSFTVAGFGCKAYFIESMFFIAGDNVIGLGIGLLIKGTIDLAVVSVDVSVEAKMALLKVTCPDTTIWGAAQVTFAVEITICWVIDIDFEAQAEMDQNLNGGPCALPDVL